MTTQYNLGRYEILEEIGSGGFATVFRANDTALKREVAIKVMRPLLMSDAGFVARFQREAQVAANLEHPHIIPIHDFGEFNGRLYLVMKLVQEGSLASRLKEGSLPFTQAVTITSQIANALDYAHEKQVIHRDLKPDNVLLGRDDHVYLGDFGLVKALEQSSLTASLSGGVLGTPAYVAPEIWHGREASPATDVYALACLFFEMISGQPLFNAPTPPATMLLHFQEPAFPTQWPANMPSGFIEVLRRGLAQDSGERFASAGAFAKALSALIQRDPLDAAYLELQTSLQEGHWDEAINQAEAILAQDWQYRDIQALLEQALKGKAEAQQQMWVTHWRNQALSAIQKADWTTARNALTRLQELDPDNPEPSHLFTQIRADEHSSENAQEGLNSRPLPITETRVAEAKAIVHQENAKTEQSALVKEEQLLKLDHDESHSYPEQATQALAMKDWDEVIKLTDEWLKLEPGNSEALDLASLACRKRIAGDNSRGYFTFR